MKDFRTLKVWERAHGLALAVYRLSVQLPRYELYGLTSQMRRASVSIAANIAEACGRSGSGDFHRFLSMAMGSALELECLLLLTRDLEMISSESYDGANRHILEVQRMLGSLIRKVETARQIT